MSTELPTALPEPVDMGLSVKWAPWNIGAADPTQCGQYFAWADDQPDKDCFTWQTYKWIDPPADRAKYINKYQVPDNDFEATWYYTGNYTLVIGDYLSTLEPADDVATQLWGPQWRTPTKEEFEELLDPNNCTWTLCTAPSNPDVQGSLVVSRITGNSIFLPCAGFVSAIIRSHLNIEGAYWSASIDPNHTPMTFYLQRPCRIMGRNERLGCANRMVGMSLRAVCDD